MIIHSLFPVFYKILSNYLSIYVIIIRLIACSAKSARSLVSNTERFPKDTVHLFRPHIASVFDLVPILFLESSSTHLIE